MPPDPLLTGIAVLTLLSDLSNDYPLLVEVDDAHWLDRSSLDTPAFAARRLESEPFVLLLGARGNIPPPGFECNFPELILQPLSRLDAGRLLDAQPHPLTLAWADEFAADGAPAVRGPRLPRSPGPGIVLRQTS